MVFLPFTFECFFPSISAPLFFKSNPLIFFCFLFFTLKLTLKTSSQTNLKTKIIAVARDIAQRPLFILCDE